MVRRLGSLLVLVGALALVPSASAAFPGPMAVQGGAGLASLDGSVHFVAFNAAAGTRIEAVDAGGTTTMSRTLSGAFGIVNLTPNGVPGRLFQGGSPFVLHDLGVPAVS